MSKAKQENQPKDADEEKALEAAPMPEDEAGEEEAAANAAAAEEAEPEEIIADLKDRLLRAVVDTENLRRRAEREREDSIKYAVTNFARDLLNVADNLSRALEAAPEESRKGNEGLTNLAAGVEMTERELKSVFEKNGIQTIEPMGEMFDHDKHQAMFKVPDTGQPAGTIVQVVQVGYLLKDRLLRPAMVGIADNGKKPNNGETKDQGPVDPHAKVDTKV